MPHTMELVTFKVFEDAEPGFLAANAKINDWLKAQPGFVARHLARKSDGGWIDIVLWEGETEAKAAATRMPVEIGECEAMRAIDPATVDMTHGTIGISFSA